MNIVQLKEILVPSCAHFCRGTVSAKIHLLLTASKNRHCAPVNFARLALSVHRNTKLRTVVYVLRFGSIEIRFGDRARLRKRPVVFRDTKFTVTRYNGTIRCHRTRTAVYGTTRRVRTGHASVHARNLRTQHLPFLVPPPPPFLLLFLPLFLSPSRSCSLEEVSAARPFAGR